MHISVFQGFLGLLLGLLLPAGGASGNPAWTTTFQVVDDELLRSTSKQHENIQLVTFTGCHFGNTDTCSDIAWFHRSSGFVWVSSLHTTTANRDQ